MIEGIKEIKQYGIKNVIIIATHGVLSGPSIDRINSCDDILHVIVTNSICQEKNKLYCSKLIVIDLGPFLGDVITRVVTQGSLSELFS